MRHHVVFPSRWRETLRVPLSATSRVLGGRRLRHTDRPDVGETNTLATLPRRAVVALWILATIALVVFMKWAGDFIVPFLLGILLTYTLALFVDLLEIQKIPRTVGAAVVVSILVAGVGWLGYALSGQAQAVVDELPGAARKLSAKIREVSASNDNVLHKVHAAASELEQAATGEPSQKATRGSRLPSQASVAPVGSTLASWASRNAGTVAHGVAQVVLVLSLSYALLAAGPLFRRKLITVAGVRLSDKKELLKTLEQIQQQLKTYLLWVALSNFAVGLLIWAAFSALHLQNPGIWGAAAFLLRFVPYAGSLALGLASATAMLLQTGSYSNAAMVAFAAFAINGAIGLGAVTWMQAKLYRVSASALFLTLLIFAWLWGIWGLLLAAPLLSVIKVVCDRVPDFERASIFLAP